MLSLLYSPPSSQFLPFSSSSKQHEKILLTLKIMFIPNSVLCIPNWGGLLIKQNKTTSLGKRKPSLPVQKNDH
jgi:hypothetical protein